MRIISLAFVFLLTITATFAQKKPSKKDYLLTISTEFGEMQAVLFDATPQHKANFLKLVDQQFYDGTLFHRIIDGFMIQGGDPDSKKAQSGQPLGEGDLGYRVPAEIRDSLFHKKGVIAAARDNNPEKASSSCQFYMAQGKVFTDDELALAQQRAGRTITDAQKQVYKTAGGIPHLDGNYTVFGEVITGTDVIDKIARQPRDTRDRPTKDIAMKITAKKMRKQKITKRTGYAYK